MKKLLIIVSCLLMLSSLPVWAQGEPEIVVVRLEEGARRIVVTRGKEQSEILRYPNAFGGEKYAVQTTEAYHQIVKKLYQEGFVLQGILQQNEGASTSLFIKAPPKL